MGKKQKQESQLKEVIYNCLKTHPEYVNLIPKEELEKEQNKPIQILDTIGEGHELRGTVYKI